jgi:hypothetical protein
MNSQSNQTVEVINEANLSVSFVSKVKFEDDNFFFWKAKPANTIFYAPIEPYSKYRLGIKFENTGNYLKDYSFMGNQVKVYGNPQLFPGPDDGNRGGSIVAMFNGTDQYVAISENLNFNIEVIKETELGFSFWYRLKQLSMAPFLDGTPKILIFHTDADDLRYACCATVAVNGNIYWYVYDNGYLYSTVAPAAFPIWNEADFDIRNYLSGNFFTTIQANEDTTTVPFNDLVFSYEFATHTPRIHKNGNLVSTTGTIPPPPFPAVLSVNTRLQINTTASAEEVGFEAIKASDRNITTLWKKISGLGSWIKAEVGELGEPLPVTLIKIAWYLGNVRRYTFVVEVSKDNTTWTQVYSGQSSGTTEALETYDFTNILALFVRVTVNGNTVNNEAAMYEFEVYGGRNLAQPEIPEEFASFTPFYTVDNTGTDFVILNDGLNPVVAPFYNVPMAVTPNWDPLNTTIFKRGEWAANSGSDLIGKTPTKISFWIRKIGSPTGTATACVRRKSDLTIRKVYGTIDVSTITSATGGAEYFFTETTSPYTIQMGDVVILEYSQATAGNRIEMGVQTANIFDVDSYKTRLEGAAWIDSTASDYCGTMAEGGLPATNLNMRACIYANAADSILVSKLMTQFTVYLKKSGSPTGTIFFRLRYFADDTVKKEYGSIAASSLTTSFTAISFTKTDMNYQFQYQDSLCIEYVPPAGVNSTVDQVHVLTRTPDAIDGTKTCLRTHMGTGYGDVDTTRDIAAILSQGGQLLSEAEGAIAQPPVYSKDLFLNAGIKGTDLSIAGNIVGFNNCIVSEFHMYWIVPTAAQALNYFTNRCSISSLALGTVAQCGYAVFTS